ncbi:unnamed protein product [Adineta steineri]|uniref:RlpA-like protein double-psi beta-barrel domain-containing protein n=3 Tax=Adineta steineri TaxID=433720 RepID=A0A815IXH6_9BILA|nr:unnamed protein product [Adineta steineri]CAF1371753.1 unnamed protein product [Adineta steineri]CAF1372760.1 unnamed protein product [Adineta steineri]
MSYNLTLAICAFAAFFCLIDARHVHQQPSSDNNNSTVVSNGKTDSGAATYYDPSMGACGILSMGDELVCAIPDALYDTKTIGGNPNNNAFCGQKISVTGPKGTVVVTIVDRCGSCKGGDLDLSRPAFDAIGDPTNGRVPITWSFI